MKTDREAMKQALEALDAFSWEQVDAARTALRERLAQPEDEPVAICEYCEKERPVIHAPQPAASVIAGAVFDFAGYLTCQKEVLQVGSSCEAGPMVKRIEDWAAKRGLSLADANVESWNTKPSAWVGLTDEDISQIEDEYIVDYRIPAGSAWNFAKDIEAKLREKNGGKA